MNFPFCFQYLTINVSQGGNDIATYGVMAIAQAMRVNSSLQLLSLVRLCC
jgi:hypothetical protein